MADPKTCGPDPWWLARAADEALTRCEMSEPGPIPDEDRAAAKAAVEAAIPHVELASAESLSARFARLPSPVALDSPEPCGGGGEEEPRQRIAAVIGVCRRIEAEGRDLAAEENASSERYVARGKIMVAVHLRELLEEELPLELREPHPASLTELQRYRYEGGDLDFEPRDSAPADWDGDLGDLIGDYFLAEDVEALLAGQDRHLALSREAISELHDFLMAQEIPKLMEGTVAALGDALGYMPDLSPNRVTCEECGRTARDGKPIHRLECSSAPSSAQDRYTVDRVAEGQGKDDWPAEFFITAIRTRGDSDEITGFDAGDVHRAEELRRNGQGPTRRYLLAPADAIPVPDDGHDMLLPDDAHLGRNWATPTQPLYTLDEALTAAFPDKREGGEAP